MSYLLVVRLFYFSYLMIISCEIPLQSHPSIIPGYVKSDIGISFCEHVEFSERESEKSGDLFKSFDIDFKKFKSTIVNGIK